MEKRYKYTSKYFDWNDNDRVLNEMGNDGWELVSVVSQGLPKNDQNPILPNPLDFLSSEKTMGQSDTTILLKGFFKKEVVL